MVTASTRVNPIQPANKVQTVEKLANGSLRVTQHSGNTFDVAPEDELFQSFIIYMILGGDE